MKRCEFLYVFKDKISIFEKVWALVCSWLSYIQVRNIQGLTPDLVTLFSEVLEKVWVLVCSCSSCYFIRNIQGPTLFQIWQLSHTFWKGVSPCMFLLCIYKGQKYTRSHTFSEKVWVLVCLTIRFCHYLKVKVNSLLLISISFEVLAKKNIKHWWQN